VTPGFWDPLAGGEPKDDGGANPDQSIGNDQQLKIYEGQKTASAGKPENKRRQRLKIFAV